MMTRTRQFFLMAALFCWAIIVGAFVYSHIAYFPGYLFNLPQSNALIKSEYGINDILIWKMLHPLAIIVTIITLVLNWRLKARRKLLLVASAIYLLAIIATFMYYVPELLRFAALDMNSRHTSALLHEGKTWFILSIVRGCFMCVGFVLLLIALSRDNSQPSP
ncbi:MAG: DUF1772 domain-containing protein, partial [Bacteroidia bacterium]|nr:DUF1772 domain-containing protein [Bacteroidia bacterium]